MKRCGVCGLEKLETDFNKKKSSPDGLNTTCRACSNRVSKEHYQKNREVYIQRAKAYNPTAKLKCRTILEEAKKGGCCHCPENDVCCLDFHHIDPNTKEDTVAELFKRKRRAKMIEEIKKCIVLCANCHRKLHAKLNKH